LKANQYLLQNKAQPAPNDVVVDFFYSSSFKKKHTIISPFTLSNIAPTGN